MNHYALEVLRDGHIIYTHGYGGSGPVLECVELLGHHLEGSQVRTVEVDLNSGRLLAFAGVTSVEAERISPGAFGVLAQAGIDIKAAGVMEREADNVSEPFEDLTDFYTKLRVSRSTHKLAWVT
ncbi:MAG: hypothetical protein LN414_03070 [Candidatus Thermoplasmatota archaeon]|nr:hypothetical protein [Candidatus Thermoplasmatota archaeon]